MSKKLNIRIGGREYEYLKGSSLYLISRDFRSEYPHDIILARVDGNLMELTEELNYDSDVEFITTGMVDGIAAYKRTLCMILVKAFDNIMGKDRKYKILIRYYLDKGFYCEIKDMKNPSKKLLSSLKNEMKRLAADKLPIERKKMSVSDAIELYIDQMMYDKVRLLRYRRSSEVTLYMLEDYADYFYGFMAPDTSFAKYFDIYQFGEGFVLQVPDRENPEDTGIFAPPEKLFNVLQQSSKWYDLMKVNNVTDLNRTIECGQFTQLMMVQEALQEKRIAEIAQQIVEKGRRIILIAGPSSSGKTTFSHRLSIQLRVSGIIPHPIPVDDYFVNREDTPLDEKGNYNFECLEAVDIKRLNEDLQSLLAGKETERPVFNFITGQREKTGTKLKIGENDVLVIEGIHALNDAMTYSIDNNEKYKIYISALTQLNLDDHNRVSTTDGRLLRRMCRDSITRGATAERTIRMWDSVRKGEEKNIFPYQENCDAMFNSELIFEIAILKQFAEPLLFSVRRTSDVYDEAKRLIKLLNYFLGVSSENVYKNSIIREFTGGSLFDVR